MKNFIKISSFLLFFSILSGCAAVGAVGPIVTGYITWKNGEAHKYYEYNNETIQRAIKKSLKALDIPNNKEEVKNDNYFILAGKNDRFKINIYTIEPNITKLSIRVNFMGDKPYAELIYKHVDDNISVISFDENGNPVKLNEYNF